MAQATQMIGGLVSGLDTANIVEQLMQLERRPLNILQNRVLEHQTKLEAYRGVNNLLLEFQSGVMRLASSDIWNMKKTTSTDESTLTATASSLAAPGTHSFQVGSLAQTAQYMSVGFADRDASPVSPYVGGTIRIDSAKSRVDRGTSVSLLNGGNGIYHGKIKITDKSGGVAIVDLSTSETVQDILDAINEADGVSVQATINATGGANPVVLGDALVIGDLSGGGGLLKVENYGGSRTATDLGILGNDASTPGSITGSAIHYLGGKHTLDSLRGGLGVNTGIAGSIRIQDRFAAAADGTTTLASLQNGRGVNNGTPGAIVAYDGTTNHVIDLSGATTLGDVMAEINAATGGVVTAALGADNNLVLTSSTGTLEVFSNGGGNTTAEDLGIAQYDATGTITGDDLTYYAFEVDLSAAKTLQGVLDAINTNADNAGVQATLGPRGLVLTGSGLGTLSVEDVGNSNTTAQDLGIAQADASGTITGYTLLADLNSVQMAALSGRHTFGGSTLLSLLNGGAGVPAGTFDITDREGNNATIDASGATTVQDVLDAINNDATVDVLAYADTANNRIVILDTSSGVGTLQVSNTATSTALGIAGDGTGARLEGTSVFAAGVNGSRGNLGQSLGEIQVTDDGGGSWHTISLADLTGADSLDDVVHRMNQEAAALFGAGNLSFRINSAGNGIEIVNGSAGTQYGFANLTGTAATDLGLDGATVAAGSTYNAGDLDRNYISRSTKLLDLNCGKGVYKGSIRYTNGTGGSGTLNLYAATTVGDVIDAINESGSGLRASINATGDGILLTDTTTGTAAIKIEEVSGGSTARDLGLLGAGTRTLDGSFERTVTVDTNDTLIDVMNKLDDSGAPVTTSIIYSGSEFNPYRLVTTSDYTGSGADFVLDTDIAAFGFQQNTKGQDAVLLYGQPGSAVSPVMLTSATNQNTTAVLGLTLDLKRVSSVPVTVTVGDDSSEVGTTMQSVVDGYNNLVDLVAELDTFDEETYTPGLLFGDSAVRSLMNSISDLFFDTVQGVDGGMMTFYDIGVTFTTQADKNGRQRARLQLDTSTLDTKLRTEFEAVRDLLTMSVDVARSDLNASMGSTLAADDDPNSPGSKFDLRNLVNGNTYSSDFGVANGFQAAGTIASGQNSVTVSFGQPKKLTDIILHHIDSSDLPASQYALRNFTVEYLDAVTREWTTLRNVTGNASSQTYMGFRVPTLVDQLRITATATNAADGKFRLVEIEAHEMQGLSGRMDEVVSELTDGTNGFFAAQEERLNGQIGDLNTSIDKMEERLDSVETELLRKFAAMEQALSQMQSQSSFFLQQMDALTASKK